MARIAKPKPPIDWREIERIMLKSFRGHGATADEMKKIDDAYKREPKEYGRRNDAVRNKEIAAIRGMGRGR